MNLNEDFIAIQGIILSTEKTAGPLKKIKHRGGNETTILNIVTELHKFLTAKNYMKDDKINKALNKQLEEICLFLIFNTELQTPFEETGFQHLINIMPQFSTCLLANVIVGLGLSNHYCQALLRFDLNVTEELLVEMIPCIKKCPPGVHIENAYIFLKLIITKVSVSTEQNVDGVEKLIDVASQMLLNLTGLHGEQIQNVKIDSVYECMGRTLLNLLDLLLMCHERNKVLNRMIEKLLKTCCSIVMAITIDVFCSWAEVQFDGEVLQVLIAGKSYMFIERYQKYPLAKELISMLGNIAQKPKSINELIQKADAPTMISMINKADPNQKHWFTALVNTQVLTSTDGIQCLERWAHLCTLGDVSRLLNLSVLTKDPAAKRAVVKCAATLAFEELVLATTRHFHQNGINNHLNENTQPQLVVLFNKIKDKTVEDEFSKDLYLLLLQNLEQTLAYIFAECLKNTFYSANLVGLWPYVKEIITIDDIGTKVLKNEMGNNLPNEHNCKNYIELFNTLIGTNLLTSENLVLGLILPLLQEAYSAQSYELLKHGLDILKDLQGNVFLKEETESFFNFLLDVMKNCRCNFLNFNSLKQEIVKLSVDILAKYRQINTHTTYTGHGIKSEDFFVSFYKRQLFEQNPDCGILGHFFSINFENHAETVAHLIKILPLCVTPEWTMISSSLIDFCQVGKTVELLCDSIILLCELVDSQENKTEEAKSMLNALKYCLQNVGIVIKECIKPKINNLQEDVALTKNVSRLLREIPAGNLRSEEGLSLASLLSDASLKSLRSDKKFACLIASIHDSNICKMLAQKILS